MTRGMTISTFNTRVLTNKERFHTVFMLLQINSRESKNAVELPRVRKPSSPADR